MEQKQIKKKLRDYFKKAPMINLPATSRLLELPKSRVRLLLFDLELEGFLKREEIKIEKNTARFWKLNKTPIDVDVDNGIQKQHTA